MLLLSLLACRPVDEPAADQAADTAAEADSAHGDTVVVPAWSLTPGVESLVFRQHIDGVEEEREVLVHAPMALEADRQYPVVMFFHGNGGSAGQNISRWQSLVESGELVGVYPQGHLLSWNLGQEASTADDVAFVEAIVGMLSGDEGIDTDRLFAAGGSNGAGLAHRLAIETSAFRGVAALSTALIAGSLPEAGGPQRSVLQVHGTADDVCPYEGGAASTGHTYLSAEESAATWAVHNDCEATPQTTTTSQGNTLLSWGDCADGVMVKHLGVLDAGHSLPPDTEGGLEAFVWAFFKGT